MVQFLSAYDTFTTKAMIVKVSSFAGPGSFREAMVTPVFFGGDQTAVAAAATSFLRETAAAVFSHPGPVGRPLDMALFPERMALMGPRRWAGNALRAICPGMAHIARIGDGFMIPGCSTG